MFFYTFRFSFSFPTLILERFGQAEDGAHSLFFLSLSYPTLLSFRRDNCRLFHLMNWKTFFHHRQRHTERERAQGFFYVFALLRSEHVTISRDGLQNWDSFEFGLVRGWDTSTEQTIKTWLSGCCYLASSVLPRVYDD
jgi:hypothetical protein